jgi:glycosyltransferase A (GT-A) superfamily protein (DUF2064 family)
LPALAIFTRVPGAGPAKTRLAAAIGPARAEALARALLLDTLSRVHTLELEHSLWYTPPEAGVELQALLRRADSGRWHLEESSDEGGGSDSPVGASVDGSARKSLRLIPQAAGLLEDRLESALRALLAHADGRVCVIGSDSPTLPRTRIEQAVESLRDVDFALVPAADGGFTLLGARIFPSGLLAGVEWSTDRVFEQTLTRLSESGAVRVLEPWYDVDTPEDLLRLAADPELARCPETRIALAESGLLEEIGSATHREVSQWE